MEFAAWLEEQMKKHHINQPGLAKAIGVTQPAISGWLSGKEAGLGNLRTVAEYFGYTLGQLLQTLEVIDPPRLNNITLTADEAEIFNDIVDLRDTRPYHTTLAAMKAVLVISKEEADSPDGT